MADENRFTVVAEWLNDWLALNGTVSENDPEKLSKFMREFGEQIIDTAEYYNHDGGNLILYSGPIAEIPSWQIVAGYCNSNPDCYYISGTYSGNMLYDPKVKKAIFDICGRDQNLMDQVYGWENGGVRSSTFGGELALEDRVSFNLASKAL